MLQAASAFGPGGVGKDYGVLESTSGSCCVVQYLAVDEIEATFPDTDGQQNVDTSWTLSVIGYSKDLGNPNQTLIRVTSIVDIITGTIRADRTLQGTCERVTAIRGQRELPPAGAIEAGGAVWLEVPFEIDALEYPLG